jgi:DNA-binding response OmpR family regulator
MRVLIVEDNNADARLVKALVEETGMSINITLVGDGEGAIQAMESAERGEAQAPDLVLLDINLPRKNGHEVLATIREMQRMSQTYIAMCSGSTSHEDISLARRNGANAYFEKPTGLEEMDALVRRLRQILNSLNDGSNQATIF